MRGGVEGGDKWSQNTFRWTGQEDVFKGLNAKNGRNIKIKDDDKSFNQKQLREWKSYL